MTVFSTKPFKVVFLVGMLCFSFGRPAFSASATELSCGFVSSYMDGRPRALAAFRKIMSTVGDEGYRSISNSFLALPERFLSGTVTEIANVGGLYVEHFLVLNSPEFGNVYFRIIYEAGADTMVGVKFLVNNNADSILKEWPVFQQPTLQKCEAPK